MLSGIRFLLFLWADTSHGYEAQWQFVYIPLLILDIPVSVGYISLKVPYPYNVGLIGTVWWFCIPILVSKTSTFIRSRVNRAKDGE